MSETTSTTRRLPRIRRIIAERMTNSLHTAAQLTAMQEADVTDLVMLRDREKVSFKEREGINLTFLPFFCRALIEACKQHPEFNSSINDDITKVTHHGAIHLGVAVDAPQGLVVPVIKNAQDLTVRQMALSISRLAEAAREGALGPDDLSGSTITITNIGSAGTLSDTPILNHPEVAILGTGAIVRRPRVVSAPEGERVEVRSVCMLPLTYDHRLIDGSAAGRFLKTLKEGLEVENFTNQLD